MSYYQLYNALNIAGESVTNQLLADCRTTEFNTELLKTMYGQANVLLQSDMKYVQGAAAAVENSPDNKTFAAELTAAQSQFSSDQTLCQTNENSQDATVQTSQTQTGADSTNEGHIVELAGCVNSIGSTVSSILVSMG